MQHTTLAEWATPPLKATGVAAGRLIQAPGDQFDWEAIEADTGRLYLLNLVAPQRFHDAAPAHWKRPKQLTPKDGIPQNVWLGMDFGAPFQDLLALWPVKRFLVLSRPEEDFELLEHALSFVRCSVCGTRYSEPLLQCPRVQLCGDAELIPQIEVFTGRDEWAKERVEELRGKWLPWE